MDCHSSTKLLREPVNHRQAQTGALADPFGRKERLNVTNRYYWTLAEHIADTTVRYTGKPATYGATLSFRFD